MIISAILQCYSCTGGPCSVPLAPAADYAAWPGVSTLSPGPGIARPLVVGKPLAIHRLLGVRVAMRSGVTVMSTRGSVFQRAT